MYTQAELAFVISPMCCFTAPEIVFFHVNGQPTAFSNMDRELDALLPQLYEARKLAQITESGPNIVRYFVAGRAPDGSDLYQMEVGIPVQPGVLSAGSAQVKILPPFACASLLLWGSLAHVAQAYDTLKRAIRDAGLEAACETREWNYWFESVDSPRNLLGIQIGIR